MLRHSFSYVAGDEQWLDLNLEHALPPDAANLAVLHAGQCRASRADDRRDGQLQTGAHTLET